MVDLDIPFNSGLLRMVIRLIFSLMRHQGKFSGASWESPSLLLMENNGNPDSAACHLGLSPSFPQLVFLLLLFTYSSSINQLKWKVLYFLHINLLISLFCMPTFPCLSVKILSDDDQNKSVCQNTL